MARNSKRKETKAEAQARTAEKFRAGVLPAEANQGGNVDQEVIVLEPTQEGLDLMARAIEEGKVARFREDAEKPPTEAELDEADEEQPEEIQPEDAEEQPPEEEEKGGVVKVKFKKRYAENAAAQGLTNKAAKRSNWDWLAQEIAKFCLDDKGKIDIRAFVALLNVNGIDHSKWISRTRGWEGRFRMTGRVALQKKVATTGFLMKPHESGVEEPFEAPMEWRQRYLPKE